MALLKVCFLGVLLITLGTEHFSTWEVFPDRCTLSLTVLICMGESWPLPDEENRLQKIALHALPEHVVQIVAAISPGALVAQGPHPQRHVTQSVAARLQQPLGGHAGQSGVQVLEAPVTVQELGQGLGRAAVEIQGAVHLEPLQARHGGQLLQVRRMGGQNLQLLQEWGGHLQEPQRELIPVVAVLSTEAIRYLAHLKQRECM